MLLLKFDILFIISISRIWDEKKRRFLDIIFATRILITRQAELFSHVLALKAEKHAAI